MTDNERLARVKRIVGRETRNFLIKARESAGLTQEQASRILGYDLVSKIQEYESGDISIPMPEMQRIVTAYGLPEIYLYDFMTAVHLAIAESEK